jgi:hypothetical protein
MDIFTGYSDDADTFRALIQALSTLQRRVGETQKERDEARALIEESRFDGDGR